MDLTVGLLFAEFLGKTILSLLLHLGIKLGIGPGQLLLDLPLEYNLCPFIVVVLPAKLLGYHLRIVSLKDLYALNAALFSTIRVNLNEN